MEETFVQQFSLQVADAYKRQDSSSFSLLFSIRNALEAWQNEQLNLGSEPSLGSVVNNMSMDQIEKVVNLVLEDISYSLAETTVNYLAAIQSFSCCDGRLYFDALSEFYSSLASLFSGQDTVFMVPLIVELSDYMVYLAFDVDMHYHFKSKAKKANIIARLLTRVFNIMLADRSPIGTSKRQGIFRVTNMAFKVYFKLNTTRLCQTFMSNIETGGVDLSLYPISDQVTYKYYLGRYALYDIRLQQAYDHLQFAFEHCGKDHWHNKRVILHYLIPAGIMMGYFPKKEYLIKYNLHNQYWPLIQALKKGDIASYLHHLYVYIDYFKGKYNVLLLRDRGIVLAWRCLVRRLYTIRKSTQATPFLTFNECVKAFNFAERTNRFTIPEIECMLVSLVSQGYIRGYLHHQKQRLVLSKVNPFPPISKVRLYREKYNESLMTEYMEKEYPPIPEEIQMLIEQE